MNWQPTCELRWFERTAHPKPDEYFGKKYQVLRQKWVHYAQWGDIDDEEWRDIPVEEECFCDKNKIGIPGVSCGDCPTRDYKLRDIPVEKEA